MTWGGWRAPLHWRGRVRRAWLQDATIVRWGLPAGVAALGFGLGLVGLGFGDALQVKQEQLLELQASNAAHQAQWAREAPVREQAQAVRAAVSAWQSALRWPQSSPWLQWPAHAKALGVTLQRIQPVSVHTTAHHVQHKVALQGQGSLSDVDAFWRELGRQGWWVTPLNMRMEGSRDGSVTWQAQWAVHQALPNDAPLPTNTGPLVLEQASWVKGWLTDGGPSIAEAHAVVSVAPAVKLDGDWSLAGQDSAEPVDAMALTPWPKTDWTHMRLVGRWVRGQQVVALVAVEDVVHAVVPGMRLGPQQHEVVQVTMDGVWVATSASDGRVRRVLHWPQERSGGDS
ncbi:MAG: hypothetical protein NWS85_02105 [Hydrogenophaga sp.]|jgi:hypothetical protein|nr:hypothetical protein [Hydrogenophaga sp.]